MLNVGHFETLIQSTTAPCKPPGALKIRSARLPKIPPKTMPRANAHFESLMRRPIQRIVAATAIAKVERNIVLLVAKLNAAPLLKVKANLKKFPKIFLSPVPRYLIASDFVARSIKKISSAVKARRRLIA